LQEANIRWFILDTHGVLHAKPRPRYGTFAPIFTPNGVAAFGRDFDSSRQVWSKHEGYPGDPRYRDFYRDIGFDLDFDYVKPHLPSPDNRGFTGMKYFRITGGGREADLPARPCAAAASEHARHFLDERVAQVQQLAGCWTVRPSSSRRMTRNCSGIGGMKGRSFWIFSRASCATSRRKSFRSSRPANICQRHPTNQIATPGASSWGEEGYWRVWLNETNEWIYPHLQIAQERMTELAEQFPKPPA
jgi:1,4-alpha-glucan branching enzyme